MGHTACTEPQCLYKGALYLLPVPIFICCPADIQDPPWEVSHRLGNILLGDNIKTNFRENGCERCIL